jgi:hypothetical protein
MTGLRGIIPLDDLHEIIAMPTPKLCSNDKAIEFANYLGRSMPTGQGTDFDIWVHDAALIFTEYPEQDVRLAVEHPAKGLRSTYKWLPAQSEVIAYLNTKTARRALILANAKRLVREHETELAERKLEASVSKTTSQERQALVNKLLGRFQK